MKTENGTHKLRNIPRKTYHVGQKLLVGFALLLVLSRVPSVRAANITVDGTTCALPDAITAANTNAPYNGCIAGDDAGGYDTIDLQADYTLTASLPVISSNIVLQGNSFTIDGGGGFRVLELNAAGDLTLNNATITGGFIFDAGGGIFNNGGTVTINNSTITNNYASSYGGGIRNASGYVSINNSTISDNTAGQSGGGIDSDNYDLTINNSTITGNNAGTYGGGIAGGGGAVTINRTIVSGNTAGTGANEILNYAATVTGGNYNLFGESTETSAEAFDGFAGFTPGATDITATSDGTTPTAIGGILITTLANNSPNGDPNTPDYPDTHALVGGSPAIDAAPSAACTAAPINNIDQRGGVRNVDLDNSATANECDIGAYEYGSTQTPTAITIEGLGVQENGRAGLAVSGAAGILVMLSGGILIRKQRRS